MRKRIYSFICIAALATLSAVIVQFIKDDPMVRSFTMQMVLSDLPDTKLPRLLPELRPAVHPFGSRKYGYIDKNGVMKIAAQFDDAGDFHEGLAAVRKGSRWGYVTTDGTMAIASQFHRARDFSNGLAAVRSNRKWGYINRRGDFVVEPQFIDAKNFRMSNAVVTDLVLFGLIDRKGKLLIPIKASKIGDFSDGSARVEIDGRVGFIKEDGNWICQPKYQDGGDFSEGLAAFSENGKWGYIDDSGAIIVQPRFKHAATFIDGAAAVKTDDDRSGIVDRRGQFLVKPSFHGLARMLKPNWRETSVISANGMTPILEPKGWGFASNNTGEPVIEPQFVEVDPFSEGMACVGVDP